MTEAQKQTGKTNTVQRQENNRDIVGAMERLSGQALPESEDYHRFIRSISLPRDEEYVQLIAKQIELLNRKEELFAELEEIRTESEEGDYGEIKAEPQTEAVQESATEPDKVQEKPVQARKGPSKEELKRQEIKKELERLDKEMAFLQKNLENMFPESKRMLTMIYPGMREGDLIRAGVIKGRGRAYSGGEELCDRIKPMTVKERAMLILGDRILVEEIEQVLNVEIYPEAVCVVYPNGLTKVYR